MGMVTSFVERLEWICMGSLPLAFLILHSGVWVLLSGRFIKNLYYPQIVF
jgi:hypothetical protein